MYRMGQTGDEDQLRSDDRARRVGIATVSPEVSYSAGGVPGAIAVNAQHTNCPSTPYEVDTYTPGTTTLSDQYAFTITIP